MSTIQKQSLGEILVSKAVITEDQLRQAIEVQKASGGDLGKIVIDLGFATEEYVTRARAKEYGLQYFDFKKYKPDADTIRLIPEAVIKRYGVLPAMVKDNNIYVVVSDPKTALVALDDIRSHLRSRNLTPVAVVNTKAEIDDAIARYVGLTSAMAGRNGANGTNGAGSVSSGRISPMPAQSANGNGNGNGNGRSKSAADGGSHVPALIGSSVSATPATLGADGDSSLTPALIDANAAAPGGAGAANGASPASGSGSGSGGHDLAGMIGDELLSLSGSGVDEAEEGDDANDEAPIIRIAHTIIQQAIRDRASDIHIEPEKKGVRIRYRVDGVLNEIMSVPKHIQAPLISRYKLISEMNIAERRVPQDGRIPIRFENKEYDLRVSSIPTKYGEKVVMRILNKESVSLSLDQLGFAPDVRDDINELVHQPNGMFLITGPTGSGKTTTLNTILTQVATIEKNVCTAEDPVEYDVPGIAQLQVNKKAGVTFASALRAFLRQDPDIIMVGEIRDLETAQIAVEASLTGHLLLSTLHTNDSPSAIMRLSDMGVEPFLLASTVIGVVAQRLARRICSNCKEAYEAPASTLRRFGFEVSDDSQMVTLYKGAGCDVCRGSGYKGRMGVYELFKVTDDIRDMIVRRAPLADLKDCAKQAGMRELREDGLRKVLAGETTPDEVMRVVATVGG